jgi:hypothetical protein
MGTAIGAFFSLALSALPAAQAQTDQKSNDQLSLAVVQAICPKQARTETLKNGTSYGCGGCPAFTSFHSDKPSQGKEPDFELRKLLTGAFTRAGSKEVLAEFFGCEPHVYNFGGTLILDQAGPTLKRVRWVPGPIGLVRTYRLTSGRDLVLSQGGYTGQGISTGWVSTYDFAKREPEVQTLVSIEDESGNACQAERIKTGYISKLEFPDLNGDGKPDLRVTVRSGVAKVPARYRVNCDEDFKPPEPPAYTIDFLFDGKSFHVAPSSAATLRRVNAARN